MDPRKNTPPTPAPTTTTRSFFEERELGAVLEASDENERMMFFAHDRFCDLLAVARGRVRGAACSMRVRLM